MARSVDEIVDLVTARIKGRLTGGDPAPTAAPPKRTAPARSPLLPDDATRSPSATRPGADGSSWRQRSTAQRDKPWLRGRAGGPPAEPEIDAELVRMIDHTQLRANATKREIEKLCEEAKQYGIVDEILTAPGEK